jgi:hypothetical protein
MFQKGIICLCIIKQVLHDNPWCESGVDEENGSGWNGRLRKNKRAGKVSQGRTYPLVQVCIGEVGLRLQVAAVWLYMASWKVEGSYGCVAGTIARS